MANIVKIMDESSIMGQIDQLRNAMTIFNRHISQLERDTESCQHQIKHLLADYAKEYAKFKYGDVVCVKEHMKKIRLVVYEIGARYEDYDNSIHITYKLSTINGFGVRNGDYFREEELEPYNK